MAHKKTKELSGWNSEDALGWVKLPLVLPEVVKGFLQVGNQSRGILGLDDYTIHIGFYITTNLFT